MNSNSLSTTTRSVTTIAIETKFLEIIEATFNNIPVKSFHYIVKDIVEFFLPLDFYSEGNWSYPEEKYFNSVDDDLPYKLSKNNRLQIMRSIDLFDYFEVSLLPDERIEKATLFMSFSVPKDPILKKEFFENGKTISVKNEEWIYDIKKIDVIYVPIKVIENPPSRFKFFDKQVPIFVLPFWRISVEFKITPNRMGENRNIRMHSYVCQTKFRNGMIANIKDLVVDKTNEIFHLYISK